MNAIGIAAAIAAVASAVAASLALELTYRQSENYKAYYSYLEVKHFEEADSQLGNSKDCMSFLSSIPEGEKLMRVLNREAGPIRVGLTEEDKINYRVCMSGFADVEVVDVSERVEQSIELDTEAIANLSRFVFRVLNIHNGIVKFSLGEFGDSKKLHSYVIRKVYKAKAIVGLVKALCDKTRFNLSGYSLMIKGMDEHTPGGVCPRVLAKPKREPRALSRLNILGR